MEKDGKKLRDDAKFSPSNVRKYRDIVPMAGTGCMERKERRKKNVLPAERTIKVILKNNNKQVKNAINLNIYFRCFFSYLLIFLTRVVFFIKFIILN